MRHESLLSALESDITVFKKSMWGMIKFNLILNSIIFIIGMSVLLFNYSNTGDVCAITDNVFNIIGAIVTIATVSIGTNLVLSIVFILVTTIGYLYNKYVNFSLSPRYKIPYENVKKYLPTIPSIPERYKFSEDTWDIIERIVLIILFILFAVILLIILFFFFTQWMWDIIDFINHILWGNIC